MTSMQLPNANLENSVPESNSSLGYEKSESGISPPLDPPKVNNSPASPDSSRIELKSDLIKMNAQDITSAYKIFLNRIPENEQVVDSRIDKSPEEILASFMNTPGFLNQPFYRNLILKLAKEIKQAYDKKNTSI